MEKPIRNAYLGTVKHDWTPTLAIEPLGNLSYLHALIFEIPKQYFIINTLVHSAVFTGHLVYVCVVVALIFRNDDSFIMRRELTPLIKKIIEFITETYENT